MVFRRPRGRVQECGVRDGPHVCRLRTPATFASKRAPPWLTGRTEKYSFTPARRAPRRRSPRSRAGWECHPDQVVLISEYTGGGFGSKGTAAISLIIPALLAKKVNAPVMMRISREEEYYIGRARPALLGRMKIGFSKEGRITGARYVRHLRQRRVRFGERRSFLRPDRVVTVSAAGHALARLDGAHQHSAARRAEFPGRHAGHHHHGDGPGAGRAENGHRSGGAAANQRAGREGAVGAAGRRTENCRTPPAPLSRKRSTAARSSSNGRSGPRSPSAAAPSRAASAFR